MTTTHLATPPPSLDLYDAGEIVGWTDGLAIGFRGFGDETEAMHAAWLAYRTMSRRFARERGRRAVPVGAEPPSLGRSGNVEHILASGRPIATLLRPAADSRSGATTYGFEVRVPVPADELTMRSTAYLVYRTLRRAGIRWAMWAPTPSEDDAPSEGAVPSAVPADDRATTAASPATAPPRPGTDASTAGAQRNGEASILGAASVIVAMLTVVVLPAITASTVVILLGGIAAVVALAALASLVRLVVTDVRDSSRNASDRGLRPSPGGAHG